MINNLKSYLYVSTEQIDTYMYGYISEDEDIWYFTFLMRGLSGQALVVIRESVLIMPVH